MPKATSAIEMATWNGTSIREERALTRCDVSVGASIAAAELARVARSAGISPNNAAAMSAANAVSVSTRPRVPTPGRAAASPAIRAITNCAVHVATTRLAAPPAAARIRYSAPICRNRRPRPAPIARCTRI